MKEIVAIVLITFACWACYELGQHSVEQTLPMCKETKLTLVASRINKDEAVCVYVESWQIKGKTKRIENVIQKKTT